MTPVFEQSVIINPFHVSTRILSLPRHNPPIIWLSCENVSRTRPCPDKIRKRGRERERKERYIETTELTNCFEMWEQRSNEIDFNFVPWSTIHLPPLLSLPLSLRSRNYEKIDDFAFNSLVSCVYWLEGVDRWISIWRKEMTRGLCRWRIDWFVIVINGL